MKLILLLLCAIFVCYCNGKTSKTDNPVHLQDKEWSKNITKVHLLFMNHLDVGYYAGADKYVGFVYQVLNRYLDEYFPRAINISKTLEQQGYRERFVYTTHPWLLSLYLDCPKIKLLNQSLKCPNAHQVEDLKQAIREGRIQWHAGAMNFQTDNLGAKLFGDNLKVGQRLDTMFGVKRYHATFSQRDVPGLTKSVIPILLTNGVKALSVGVNPSTAPPAVPNLTPFLWKFSSSDPDGLISFFVKGGYPLNPGPYPSDPEGLSKDKCNRAEGISEALCFSFRTDNTGPPDTIQEVLKSYEILRAEFPNAEIVASSFDNFVASLETIKATLPVKTYEIGDTWIMGIASDPVKLAQYRAIERNYEDCFKTGKCNESDPRVSAMTRYLLKLPEHTWGAHNFLDNSNWTNAQLKQARTSKSFQEAEDAWREQREFINLTVEALKDHPLSRSIRDELLEMKPTFPNLTDYKTVPLGSVIHCSSGLVIGFDQDGSVSKLYDPVKMVDWANKSAKLGSFIYDTFDEQDFIDFNKHYAYTFRFRVGFDKINVTSANPQHKRWSTKLSKVYIKENGDCDVLIKVQTGSSEPITKYGAPQFVYINYVEQAGKKGMDVTLLMFNKTTTRLPESISFQFTPSCAECKWSIEKMGRWIDPCDVVKNGSQYIHGIDSGVKLTDGSGNILKLLSKDLGLVLLGTDSHKTSPFPMPLEPIRCPSLNSIAFNYYNNIWNTNYIYWYPYEEQDKDFKARFSIQFGHST